MTAKHLIVAIRGWTNSDDWLLFGRSGGEIPSETLDALQAALPESEVWAPPLSLPMFCMDTPERVSRELFSVIDSYIRARPELTSITLLGYSAGSLLARRIFCIAHGASESGEIDQAMSPWAHKVHRLVMLAGITRGWEFSTASPDHVRFLSPVLLMTAKLIGKIKGIGKPADKKYPFIWQLQRGSSFVVGTRLQYVRVVEALRENPAPRSHAPPLTANGVPSTVFLLGARDEYISPADCTELGPRSEFAYIELPGANHSQALLVDGDEVGATLRRQRLVSALNDSFFELSRKPWVVSPADIDDYLDPMDLAGDGAHASRQSRPVEHVVMVVHGIRDHGFWTKRVAREIKVLAREMDIVVRAPSPSYGYFSMWDFVKPGGRERAARWFMECYADIQSHFPGAKISFVGHSNGTYIAARALKLCPGIRFHRVVLAGSVVRCDFAWPDVGQQVGHVLNYVGSADSVVAFLPAVFERLGLSSLDVGGAGAYGFTHAKESLRSKLPFALDEVQYVEGGHGAAIGEGCWPEIAKFVLAGQVPVGHFALRGGWLKWVYRTAPLLTVSLVALAFALLTAPVTATAWTSMRLGFPVESALITAAALMCGLAISWLVGRVLKAW